MESVILKSPAKQLFEVQPQQSHPRLSLRRVLYVKLLRWLDQATFRAILKTLSRACGIAFLALAVFVPQFLIGYLSAVLHWHSYRVPLFALLLSLTWKGRSLLISFRRMRSKAGNQHTFQGVPVDELASFLMEEKKFIREDAMRRLGISQEKHQKIAEKLEAHHVLIRGENNARMLNTITREQLVRQLREDFPLAFHNDQWAERRGSYERFLADKERADRKEQEKVERLERKRDRLQRQVGAFQQIMTPELV